ncbi:hypothetical protein MRB53_000775 [Persea americana]|uniref:Uncharacterized protein n=1 Tax=Persea americana TaxID=3435 RepID=A0ACC2MPT4_PERAE|nr:hypothetical protein MRB53_000775 [Persea americana]
MCLSNFSASKEGLPLTVGKGSSKEGLALMLINRLHILSPHLNIKKLYKCLCWLAIDLNPTSGFISFFHISLPLRLQVFVVVC